MGLPRLRQASVTVLALLCFAPGTEAQPSSRIQLQRVERDGVSVLFFQGTSASDVELQGSLHTVQRWNDVVLGLRRGPNGVIEGWSGPADLPHASSSIRSVRVCDQRASLLVLELPEEQLRMYPAVEPGEPVMHRDITNPAMTHVELSFTWQGRAVLITWWVETSRRAELRDHERRFFQSVHCS